MVCGSFIGLPGYCFGFNGIAVGFVSLGVFLYGLFVWVYYGGDLVGVYLFVVVVLGGDFCLMLALMLLRLTCFLLLLFVKCSICLIITLRYLHTCCGECCVGLFVGDF